MRISDLTLSQALILTSACIPLSSRMLAYRLSKIIVSVDSDKAAKVTLDFIDKGMPHDRHLIP